MPDYHPLLSALEQLRDAIHDSSRDVNDRVLVGAAIAKALASDLPPSLPYVHLADKLANIERRYHAGDRSCLLDAIHLANHVERLVEPDEDKQKTEAPKKTKLNINARMLEILLQRGDEARGWSSQRWAAELKCAKSSVAATDTWKMLEMTRLELRASRAKDRHRRPKASDQKRD